MRPRHHRESEPACAASSRAALSASGKSGPYGRKTMALAHRRRSAARRRAPARWRPAGPATRSLRTYYHRGGVHRPAVVRPRRLPSGSYAPGWFVSCTRLMRLLGICRMTATYRTTIFKRFIQMATPCPRKRTSPGQLDKPTSPAQRPMELWEPRTLISVGPGCDRLKFRRKSREASMPLAYDTRRLASYLSFAGKADGCAPKSLQFDHRLPSTSPGKRKAQPPGTDPRLLAKSRPCG